MNNSTKEILDRVGSEIKFSHFCLMISEDTKGRFLQVLDYPDFHVWKDTSTGKFYYLEAGENDASAFFEVRKIAELRYDCCQDTLLVDGAALSALFDCSCCGEDVDSKTYLWFKIVEKTSEK